MKLKSSLKVEQAGDKIIRRGGKLVRINKLNPRRKARQRVPKKNRRFLVKN